ncbi:MAG TPA: hypothetical protein VNS55_08415 [Nocardioides sp.]|nr:hypothetical protein [Nocardioides sp.]
METTATTHRPDGSAGRTARSLLIMGAIVVGFAAVVAVSGWLLTAPRAEVPVPGPDATPAEVVTAYVDAINARDFDTANAIDGRDGHDLGRFSRAGRMDDLRIISVDRDGRSMHVLFEADFSGMDASMEDVSEWGYYLRRGADGCWHIEDAGVA